MGRSYQGLAGASTPGEAIGYTSDLMERDEINLGSLKLSLVNDGGFRLDGGAMFGVVPKTLWQKKKPADDLNRISMATNCLLVERGDELLLIDTGIGEKNDAKFRQIFGIEEEALRLPDQIRRAGYELGDVTHVLLSHLHFDHSERGLEAWCRPFRRPGIGCSEERSNTPAAPTRGTGRATIRVIGSRFSRPAW